MARWLHVSYAGDNVTDCPEYTEPPTGGVEGSMQRREKRAILERVAAQEAQLQKLLADLDNERSRAEQAESTAEERQAAFTAINKTPDVPSGASAFFRLARFLFAFLFDECCEWDASVPKTECNLRTTMGYIAN